MLWSSNGTLPHTRTYKTIPKLQRSTSGPVYAFAFNNSGAAKYNEPQKVDKCDCGENRLERPKSMILICPERDIKMFSIFKSSKKREMRFDLKFDGTRDHKYGWPILPLCTMELRWQ